MKKFAEWKEDQVLNEMSARRSFWRTIGKFVEDGKITTKKPIAILTAFRADIPGTETQKLTKNRRANEILKQRLEQFGFSWYPILGMGQEEDDAGDINTQREESFIVQPRQHMPNDEFAHYVKNLAFSSGGTHQQWGAVIKLPGKPVVLMHHGGEPQSPEDYNQTDPLGTTAKVRTPSDPYYTQMAKGPPRQFAITNDQPQ